MVLVLTSMSQVHPIKPWNWPQDWFKKFLVMRKTSKTYRKVDEFFKPKRKWPTDKIFNRYLFWNTIKLEEAFVSMELLDWLCKDNTKSKWTLSLHLIPDLLLISSLIDSHTLVYTFYFKDRSDLLLFKMRW